MASLVPQQRGGGAEGAGTDVADEERPPEGGTGEVPGVLALGVAGGEGGVRKGDQAPVTPAGPHTVCGDIGDTRG